MLPKLGNQAQVQRSITGMNPWVGRVGLSIAVGVAYFLAARVGLALLTDHVAVFWPAAGVAAGSFLVIGRWARMPVAVAVMVASATASLMGDRNVWAAISFALCNTGEALLAAWLIERFFGSVFRLEKLRQVLGLLAVAAITSASAAAVAAVAMGLFGPSKAPWLAIWLAWFASDALGIITVAPLLVGLGAAVRDPPSLRELIEGACAVVGVAVINGFALALFSGAWALIAPATILFPLLLWLGSRCRPVFAAAAVLSIAAAIVCTTTYEIGRYGDPSQPLVVRVLAAQVSMLGTALAALALAALFAERRRHEGALGESDRRLRSILDAANVIAWDVDLSRNTVHSAGPVGRVLDWSQDSEPRDLAAFVETIHPEDRDRVMAQFWSAVSTAPAYRLEFRLHASGNIRWVTAEGSIERDRDGRPVRVRGVTHDITERKNAELTLAERDEQLALAGKTARVGSYVKDTETGKMQISTGYAAIHGLSEGTTETTAEEWRARVHPDDLGRLDASRNNVVAERGREHNAEYRIIGPDGSVRWIEARALISYGDDGRAQRIVGINIDVTDRKRGEEHQRLLTAELDHRVKNVLASVAVVARRTSERNSSTRDFIEVLDHRLQSMAEAHALLSRSRWEGVSLADLVAQELGPFATPNNTMVEGPNVGLTAAATQAMAMVLHELATNAAKYGALSTPQGRVSVRWRWRSNGGAQATLMLEWQEEDGPVVTVPAQTGYGTSVIRDLIPYELGGTVELQFAPDGVRCTVVLSGEQARYALT